MRAHSMFDCDFVHRNKRCIYFSANCAMLYGNIWYRDTESVISLVRAGEFFSFLCLLFENRNTLGHTLRQSELRSLAIFIIYTQQLRTRKKKRNIHTHTHTLVRSLARSHIHSSSLSISSKWTYNLNGKQAGRQTASQLATQMDRQRREYYTHVHTYTSRILNTSLTHIRISTI